MESPNSETRTPVIGASKWAFKSANGNGSSRRALLDMTNDSPTLGLTRQKETTPKHQGTAPSSKSRGGRGEALLRSQVRALLKNVGRADENIRHCHNDFVSAYYLSASPSTRLLLAPTPANTPVSSAVSSHAGSSGMERPVRICVGLGTGIPYIRTSGKDKGLDMPTTRALRYEEDEHGECASVAPMVSSEVSVTEKIASPDRIDEVDKGDMEVL